MKKNLIFTLLLVLVLALGLALAACSGGDDDTGAPVEEPLVFTKTMNGKTVVVMITRNNPVKDAITPKQGDYYVIYLDGKIISYGRITTMTEAGRMTFTPAGDSPGIKVAFEGTLDNSGSLYIAEIPYEGGNISGFSAVESGRVDSGGGTGGTGGGGGGGGTGGGTLGGGNPFTGASPNTQPQTYTLTLGTATLTYTESDSVSNYGFTTTHYLLYESYISAGDQLKYSSPLGLPDEESGGVNVWHGTILSDFSENWVIFEVDDWTSKGYGTSYRLVQCIAGVTNGMHWESKDIKDSWLDNGDPWERPPLPPPPPSGSDITLPDGTTIIPLPYSEVQALDGYNHGWRKTSYKLTDNYATAVSAIIAVLGDSLGDYSNYGGGFMDDPDWVVFDVFDFTAFSSHPYGRDGFGWVQCDLMEKASGNFVGGVYWDTDYKVTGATTGGTTIALPDGTTIPLPYSETEEILIQRDGKKVVQVTRYLLSDSFPSARIESELVLDSAHGWSFIEGEPYITPLSNKPDWVIFEVEDYSLYTGTGGMTGFRCCLSEQINWQENGIGWWFP